jgi:hypothetical protein
MTHRYTVIRARGYVAGGTCGICKREYSGKVCPYCTQTVLGLLAVALLFAPVLLGGELTQPPPISTALA